MSTTTPPSTATAPILSVMSGAGPYECELTLFKAPSQTSCTAVTYKLDPMVAYSGFDSALTSITSGTDVFYPAIVVLTDIASGTASPPKYVEIPANASSVPTFYIGQVGMPYAGTTAAPVYFSATNEIAVYPPIGVKLPANSTTASATAPTSTSNTAIAVQNSTKLPQAECTLLWALINGDCSLADIGSLVEGRSSITSNVGIGLFNELITTCQLPLAPLAKLPKCFKPTKCPACASGNWMSYVIMFIMLALVAVAAVIVVVMMVKKK